MTKEQSHNIRCILNDIDRMVTTNTNLDRSQEIIVKLHGNQNV